MFSKQKVLPVAPSSLWVPNAVMKSQSDDFREVWYDRVVQVVALINAALRPAKVVPIQDLQPHRYAH